MWFKSCGECYKDFIFIFVIHVTYTATTACKPFAFRPGLKPAKPSIDNGRIMHRSGAYDPDTKDSIQIALGWALLHQKGESIRVKAGRSSMLMINKSHLVYSSQV